MKTITYDETKWRLLPADPDQAMSDAGWDVVGWPERDEPRIDPRDVYRAMLAAATQPPEVESCDARDIALELAATVIELYDDATIQADFCHYCTHYQSTREGDDLPDENASCTLPMTAITNLVTGLLIYPSCKDMRNSNSETACGAQAKYFERSE